ncbi:MAG: hypothetical protein LBQ73_11640 [Tannerellaceae bacterium]|jgi:hypothetical protein|nr:hypothetical protein [Tannerellaceae bacterium]
MDAKPYKAIETDSPKVQEPAVAYSNLKSSEVEELRAKAVDLLMKIKDPELLESAIDELELLTIIDSPEKSPIQFTVEELKERLLISIEESRRGVPGVSHEEMLKRSPEWWIKQLKHSPFQLSVDELKEHLYITMEESRQGLGIRHEDVIKMKPEWFRP